MTNRRSMLWGGLLLLAVVAVALAPPADRSEPGLVDAVQRGQRPVALAADAGQRQPTVLRIAPRRADADADAGRLWQFAPPPVVAAAAPAPASRPTTPQPPPPPPPPAEPVAPALPFKLLGRYADGSRVGVILQGADGGVLLAHAGDTLAGQYRVDTIAGNAMVLTYLPLNLHQTMDIGISR